jgi:glycosyltransferase involved in cell wall biosynthesis
MEIKFSVIVNCKNSQEYLNDCLESILNQSYKNFELIIINNNSTDSTFKIINSFKDERIKYFNTEKDLSLGAARNLGIKYSTGSYIGFLDSDDLWLENKLEETIKTIELFDSSIIYSNVLYFNEKKSEKLYSNDKSFNLDIFEQQIANYNLCISSCVINRFYLSKLDFYFDEKLEVCEDYDIFLRLLMLQNASFIPEILTKYRIHDNNLTKKKRHLFFKERYIVVERLKSICNLPDHLYKRIVSEIFLDHCKSLWKQNDNFKALSLLIQNSKLKIDKKVYYSIIFLIPYKLVSPLFEILRLKKMDI